jgi:hypothetical protein
MYVSSVLRRVLQVLHLDLRMLQVLHLDVSKIDRVLHLAPSSTLATSPWCLHLLSVPAGHPSQRRRRASPPPLLLDAGGASWDDGVAGDGPPRVHAGTRAPSVPLRGGGISALVSSIIYAEVGRLLFLGPELHLTASSPGPPSTSRPIPGKGAAASSYHQLQ